MKPLKKIIFHVIIWGMLAAVLTCCGLLFYIKKNCNLADAVMTDKDFTAYCLVLMGADPNAPGEDGETPLVQAVSYGHIQAAEKLLEFGADVNRASEDGKTPLMAAVGDNHLEMVQWLLHKGADAQARDAQGRPVTAYVRYQNADTRELLDCLTENGAVLEPTQGGEILLYAAGHDRELVEFLLDKGIDVNYKNGSGFTALMVAVCERNEALARYLLEKGADPAALNRHGWNALAMAADNADVECTALLLEKVDYVPLKANDQLTALQRAALAGSEAIATLLIKHAAPGVDLKEDLELALLRIHDKGYLVLEKLLGAEQWRHAVRRQDPSSVDPVAQTEAASIPLADLPAHILRLDRMWNSLDKKGKDVIILCLGRINDKEVLLQTIRQMAHLPLRANGLPLSLHFHHAGITQQDLEAILDIPSLPEDTIAALAVMIHEFRFGVSLPGHPASTRFPMAEAHGMIYGGGK